MHRNCTSPLPHFYRHLEALRKGTVRLVEKTGCTRDISLPWCYSTACLDDEYLSKDLSKDLSSETSQEARTIIAVWQADSQNSRLLFTAHHVDTNRLLLQGREFILSVSLQTLPLLCFPAKTQGLKPQFLRATTGGNSRNPPIQKQFPETHNGVLHS